MVTLLRPKIGRFSPELKTFRNIIVFRKKQQQRKRIAKTETEKEQSKLSENNRVVSAP